MVITLIVVEDSKGWSIWIELIQLHKTLRWPILTFICLVRSTMGKYNSGLFGDVDELKNKIKKQQKINMIESPITKYSNTIMCNTSLYSIFKKINTLKCKLQHCWKNNQLQNESGYWLWKNSTKIDGSFVFTWFRILQGLLTEINHILKQAGK